jgi:6-phosphogluconolactonase (cycloisomerase 2 family)
MMIVNKQFLYIPNGDNTVVGYSIDRTSGAATLIGSFSMPVGSLIGAVTADDVATDPHGKFLFVGSETLPVIWAFLINPASGVLTASPGSPYITGFSAGGVTDILAVDASGLFLYAGQLDNTLGVAGFTIDPNTGALTPLAGSPFTTIQVAQIRTSPTAEILVGVQQVQDKGNLSTDTHIYAYGINSSTGALTLVSSPTTIQSPFDLAISPTGSYVYAMEQDAATGADTAIEGFTLNSSTGALASLGTFSGVPTAEGCKFDQSGIYLFCVDFLAGTTLTVNFDNLNNGQLTHGADLTVSGNFPFAVTD